MTIHQLVKAIFIHSVANHTQQLNGEACRVFLNHSDELLDALSGEDVVLVYAELVEYFLTPFFHLHKLLGNLMDEFIQHQGGNSFLPHILLVVLDVAVSNDVSEVLLLGGYHLCRVFTNHQINTKIPPFL